MKRFLICSLIAVLPIIDGMACISERNTHNSYMFSVYRRNALTDGPAYLYDIDRYWQNYAGKNMSCGTDFYKWYSNTIMQVAQSKGDKEMTAYLTLLNSYMKTCDAYTRDAWNYPTKEEMTQRHNTLTGILAKAKAYGGTALRQQYVLLQMRTNMMLGNDNANITQIGRAHV